MSADNELDQADDGTSASGTVSPTEILTFIANAHRRHRRLGIGLGLGVAVAGLALAQVLPLSYEANSRIFIDESVSKAEALSNPDRALPNLDTVSGAFELLTQKSSLIAIANETGLPESWDQHRLPALRLKDRFISWIKGGGPTRDEKSEFLAKKLANRIVYYRDKSVVNIRVDWMNPVDAFHLATTLQNRLVDLIRTRETASFSEAISILSDETKRAREAISPALAELVRARQSVATAKHSTLQSQTTDVAAKSSAPARSTGNQAASNEPDPAPGPSPAAAAKLAELNAKIQASEDQWHRRQQELSAHMAELRTVYGQEHPQVLQQEAQIKAAAEPPFDLVELRKSRANLLSETYASSPERKRSAGAPSVARAQVSQAVALGAGAGIAFAKLADLESRDEDEDPLVSAARAEFRRVLDLHERVAARLESARLQFVAAQAAFDKRYVVTGAPELPQKPQKPLRVIVSLASVLVGALLMLAIGAIRDLLSGKVHEPWQLNSLGLRTIGELVPDSMAPEEKGK